MVTTSLTYSLSLSQEQLRGFVEFCDAFNKLFLRYANSVPNGMAKLPKWHQAYLSVVFIKISHSMGPTKDHNFGLTAEHVKNLKEILKIADDFQRFYSKLPQEARNLQDDSLYQHWLASFELFRGAVKKALEQIEL